MGNLPRTEEIPNYLKPYIATQDPSFYTPMDHASWRYILRISEKFFAKHAHQKYLDGLRETGISIDRIPLIGEMDSCLKKFNWRAVPVSGFIPPAVFMEFLSLGVLPIACDMRTLDHLAYTPAPDIVHEAAGHAPIIADVEYADYLRSYGEISRKAIYSREDMDVYHAIRHLSDTKEDPKSSPETIAEAQKRLDLALASVTYESEATLLSRMAWWTFEYGMVGSLQDPKIYGAGLLSSLGESFHCFSQEVKKIPFSVDCIKMSYDITRPQPQLYVSPDFQSLKTGLGELSSQMSFRRGGVEGLEKAKQAKTATTTVLDSGIQITGILGDFSRNSSGRPDYIRWIGPTQLSYQDRELDGQGADYHRDGYSSPIEPITEEQLKQAGWVLGKKGQIQLQSGVVIEGEWVDQRKKEGHLILLTFDHCTVRRGSEVLFKPEWGKFDVVCGRTVISVFGGAADRQRYMEATGENSQALGKQKTNLTEDNRKLNDLYARVRSLRESGSGPHGKAPSVEDVTLVYRELEANYSRDWLLRYELLELLSIYKLSVPWDQNLRERLKEISKESAEKAETIQRGLELLNGRGQL